MNMWAIRAARVERRQFVVSLFADRHRRLTPPVFSAWRFAQLVVVNIELVTQVTNVRVDITEPEVPLRQGVYDSSDSGLFVRSVASQVEHQPAHHHYRDEGGEGSVNRMHIELHGVAIRWPSAFRKFQDYTYRSDLFIMSDENVCF